MKTYRQAINNLLGIDIKQKGIRIEIESKKYNNDLNYQVEWANIKQNT